MVSSRNRHSGLDPESIYIDPESHVTTLQCKQVQDDIYVLSAFRQGFGGIDGY